MRRAWLLALLLAVLGAVRPARAKDTCLAGEASLGDRRAFAALRDATETACPCATARSRGAYQRCARRALRTALHGKSLRRACKATAADLNKGATCGSERVTCAHQGTTPSCRVVPASRCQDTVDTQAAVCEHETHCIDVLERTAATCLDVQAPGPYAVGVRVVRFTKKSVVDPTADRVLDTYVWYPAVAGTGTPSRDGERDADIDPSSGPYPLLLFSHGACGIPNQSDFLTAHLATYGFVVAAPPHPGNQGFDFPGCFSIASVLNSVRERPADIIFVTDQLLAATADSGSPFHGVIDPARIGIAGHSLGGNTTYRVAIQDSRYRAALAMAPAGPQPLSIPSMVMLATNDTVLGALVGPNAKDAIRMAFASSAPPRFELEIADTGHFAFSDSCAGLFGEKCATDPANLTQGEAHAMVLRYAVPFLMVEVAGDPRFAPFLEPPAPSGIVFERAP